MAIHRFAISSSEMETVQFLPLTYPLAMPVTQDDAVAISTPPTRSTKLSGSLTLISKVIRRYSLHALSECLVYIV